MRKKRARARDTRTMGEGPTRPLRVSLARKTRENRTVISVFSLFLSLSFTLLKRHHIVCLQAALSRTVPRAMMALLESLTVWHEDDYKLIEILPFASLVIKLRKEGWKQKCKWSIETSPNALQVRRNIHFCVTEFKILWKYPQQIICEAKERRSRGETLINNNQNIKTPASVTCCNSRLCVSKSVNIVISACLREKDQIYR